MQYSLALMAFVTGGGMLYLGWKRRVSPSMGKLVGWVLVTLGSIFAVSAWGAEFGPIYAALMFACAALVCVGLEAEAWRPKTQPGRVAWPRVNLSNWFKHGVVFFFAVFISGLASLFSVVLVSQWLDGPTVDRMTFVLLTTPLLWGCIMFWTLCSPRLAKSLVSVTCLLSAMVLFL